MSPTAELIEGLNSTRSAERRKAAKKLLALEDRGASAALIEALRKEVQDPRTWETQYFMAAALGECGDPKEAIPLLEELARVDFEATQVLAGVGYALARLRMGDDHDAEPILELLREGTYDVARGALQTLALKQIPLNESQAGVVMDFIEATEARDSKTRIRFWALAAAAEWQGDRARQFLEASSAQRDYKQAAQRALAGKYTKVRL